MTGSSFLDLKLLTPLDNANEHIGAPSLDNSNWTVVSNTDITFSEEVIVVFNADKKLAEPVVASKAALYRKNEGGLATTEIVIYSWGK